MDYWLVAKAIFCGAVMVGLVLVMCAADDPEAWG